MSLSVILIIKCTLANALFNIKVHLNYYNDTRKYVDHPHSVNCKYHIQWKRSIQLVTVIFFNDNLASKPYITYLHYWLLSFSLTIIYLVNHILHICIIYFFSASAASKDLSRSFKQDTLNQCSKF